jgi:hypothetical protein
MKRFSNVAVLWALALASAFFLFASEARAQVGPPVMVKEISPKPVWLKAEVVRFDRNSITVRDSSDELKILTFTYAASAQLQVEKSLDQGGYQFGDKVKIRYVPGQSIALAIHGKPSKTSVSNPRKPTAPLRPRPASKPQ